MAAANVWTAPRDWTTGELVTAALLNSHIRDNETHLKNLASAALALALS